MKRHELNVHNLPRDVAESDLAGSVVVVIDLLRATSTICQAVASGASEVVPFLEVDDALTAAEKAGRSGVVLGGERKGGRIPGFDLGNSPCEYTPAIVAGRRVFFTTTNGTRALHHARLARRVVVGALLNLSAVVASIQDEPRVDILCAGTGGHPTREDILAAGAMASGLAELSNDACDFNEAALTARREWELAVESAKSFGRPLNDHVAIELRNTQGGQNLLGIGLDRDLVDCSQIDQLNVIPELDVPNWRITT
jgi:2-phosphosulfolactate phosphatase